MSEGRPAFEPVPVPEHIEHSHKRGWAKLAEPLMASVPTLIGVLLGGIMSHFAETQRVDFEREDRFRREQIQRIAQVAHGYQSLADPLLTMIGIVESRQPSLCRQEHGAALAEAKFTKMGLLHEREFAPGPVDFTKTNAYIAELNAVPASNAAAKGAANGLLELLSQYAGMIGALDPNIKTFFDNRKTFQTTLAFDAKVYFPKAVQAEVDSVVNRYYIIEKQMNQLATPNLICSIDPEKTKRDLVALNVTSQTDMIAFAQSLEPELGNSALQPDLPPRQAAQTKR